MTVLGFDNITVGFCLHQCVPASVLGGLMGVSALVGVCGSLSFPVLRRRFNVTKAGLVGFVLLVVALVSCVVSLWLPGSPFVLYEDRADTSGNLGVEETGECFVPSRWSVGAMLLGLILARYGLWVADISVTQVRIAGTPY